MYNDSSADIPVENSSDPVNISSPVLDNVAVDQPLEQHSSDSTIQDYTPVSEENIMELFTELQISSRPTGNVWWPKTAITKNPIS